MTELVFEGKFEVSDTGFLEKFNSLLTKTKTNFKGRILQYNTHDYTEYEEVIDSEKSTDGK